MCCPVLKNDGWEELKSTHEMYMSGRMPCQKHSGSCGITKGLVLLAALKKESRLRG